MTRKIRRNHGKKPTRSGPPFNELWESFNPILAPIFDERKAEGKRNETYVPVPHVERQLDDYITSDSNHVAILHGLMGAGKTTVLEHISVEVKKQSPDTICQLINFQGRRFHLMPDSDTPDKRSNARKMVTQRLNDLLTPFLQKHRDYVNIQFFEFLVEFFIAEIGRPALFARSETDKIRILEQFMSDEDKTAPMQCFIIYMCIVLKTKNFMVMVDNVDEKPYEVVEGLFFALSDFLDCLNRPRERSSSTAGEVSSAPNGDGLKVDTKFRAILACRSHTFEALRADQEGILPTRGFHEIHLDSKSLLTKIIKKRLEAAQQNSAQDRRSRRSSQETPYILRSGASVEMADAWKFVDSFIARLALASVETDLFKLFNCNHARAIENIKHAIQNRYFISYDADVLGQGQIRSDFQFARVLKATGYGNPPNDEDLYYPALSSIIPNIFEWDPQDENTFLSIVRILKIVSKSRDAG